MLGFEVQEQAHRMFKKWCEMFAPDFDGDHLDLVTLYSRAPEEQHKAAAEAAGIKDVR